MEMGIKPIIGAEIYISKRTRHDKEAGIDSDSNHLVLLAKNIQGYKNLMKIISIANLRVIITNPEPTWSFLREYHEGLICLTACLGGFISDPLMNNQQETAEKRAKELNEIFGQGNFYLELQKHINHPRPGNIKYKID